MVRTFFITGIILAALGRIAMAQGEAQPPRKLEDANRAEDLQILSAIVTENVNGLYGLESRRVAGGTDATGPMTGAGALSSAGAWLYVAGGHPTTPGQPTRA